MKQALRVSVALVLVSLVAGATMVLNKPQRGVPPQEWPCVSHTVTFPMPQAHPQVGLATERGLSEL